MLLLSTSLSSSSSSMLSSILLISSISLQIIITTTVWLLLPFFPHHFILFVSGQQQIDCDILNPKCQERYRQMMHTATLKSKTSQCLQRDIWLIPGKADISCSRPRAKKILEVDPRQVVIYPKIIKLPGCFNVEIKNIRVLDNHDAIGNSFFAKIEYQWWNVKDFANLKCQNASSNGCGGYGNNCYYCDICESLHHLQEENGKSAFTDQLKGINCPKYPGFYTFRKEFCFNDWSIFDINGDCQFDFFQGDKFSDYRSALSSLQQVGYGTVVAKLRLAANATGEVAKRKRIKEELIEETIRKDLEERGRTSNIGNEQFEKFRLWYTNYRKDTWHREEYLPWLLYENEISCIRLTFDICERIPKRSPFTGQLTCF